MYIAKNILLSGSDQKPMPLDIFYEEDGHKKPVVIYAHGFNGFKDWGRFDLIAERFAANGFVFVKFNFSHNGTSPAQPDEFVDLEAFGNNNYSMEIYDLGVVVDWVLDPVNAYRNAIDTDRLCLLGHSMGGGIVLLEAARNKRITRVITWAAISECHTPWGSWSPEKLREWKDTGVQYYTNSRTGQQMPLRYQLHEDYQRNCDQLDIRNAIKGLDIPILLCHGTLDTAVPVEKAFELQRWQPNAQLFTVESDHVFGRRHPWTSEVLPSAMEAVLEANLQFLNR